MLKFEALKIAEKICDKVSHKDLDILFKDLGITRDRGDYTKEKCEEQGIDYYYACSRKNRIVNALTLESDEKSKQLLEILSRNNPEINKALSLEYKQSNIVEIEKKFENQNLQNRYEELIKAVNNDMPLSFFWLAGSIIEAVLCEYCKKNNIKSKDNIDEYITALENNNKISKGSTIYTTLQHFRLFRNTIHPTNQNNDFIKDKNLQNRREELDDVIEYFSK